VAPCLLRRQNSGKLWIEVRAATVLNRFDDAEEADGGDPDE
jgi:hypothetical protein